MEFEIGEQVVHPTHGVGHVVKLEERKFGRKEPLLYYEVTTENCTVWVPAEKHRPLSLRPLTKKSELKRYRKILKSEPEPLHENHRTRRADVSKRLKEGTFQAVCEVVRDLTAYGWESSLTTSDETLLRNAREALFQEWAIVTGMTPEEAEREVDSLLSEAEEAYAPVPEE